MYESIRSPKSIQICFSACGCKYMLVHQLYTSNHLKCHTRNPTTTTLLILLTLQMKIVDKSFDDDVCYKCSNELNQVYEFCSHSVFVPILPILVRWGVFWGRVFMGLSDGLWRRVCDSQSEILSDLLLRSSTPSKTYISDIDQFVATNDNES